MRVPGHLLRTNIIFTPRVVTGTGTVTGAQVGCPARVEPTSRKQASDSGWVTVSATRIVCPPVAATLGVAEGWKVDVPIPGTDRTRTMTVNAVDYLTGPTGALAAVVVTAE